MYCLFELLTVVCLVVIVAAILFVVCAAVILVNEGVRNVLGLSAEHSRRVASFFSTPRTGWKITVFDRLGSFFKTRWLTRAREERFGWSAWHDGVGWRWADTRD